MTTEKSVFTPAQWEVLNALLDTIIAPLTDEEINSLKADATARSIAFERDAEGVSAFLRQSATSAPGFRQRIEAVFQDCIAPDAIAEAARTFSILRTIPGSLILTGSTTPIHLRPRHEREKVLLQWANSRFAKIRGLYATVKGLATNTFVKSARENLKALGYEARDADADHPERYTAKTFPAYKFLSLNSDDVELTYDAVVIGSGSGGGVTAARLAQAGHRVLVLEKGQFFPHDKLTLSEAEAHDKMYQSRGTLFSDDASTFTLAGSTFGGGSTINWSGSLQTQGYVREEWAREGCTFYREPIYQEALDHVCHRMGVSDKHIRHNPANQTLVEGARRLGYPVDNIPQNTMGTEHWCGYCGHGCRFGEKAGGVMTWLKDAADAGAEFVCGAEVEKVVIEKGKARGVVCRVKREDGKEVVLKVNAKTVVVAGGSLNSPLILKRSGLKNPHIGRNLHLHPVICVAGFWDSKRTEPYKGGIMTAVSPIVENLDHQGHGPKLECLSMQPALAAAVFPWKGAKEYKRLWTRYDQCVGYISLTRDRDSGRVFEDEKTGLLRLEYTPSAFDRGNMLEGAIKIADCLVAGGVDEIVLSTAAPTFRVDHTSGLGISDPKYVKWVEEVRRMGVVTQRDGVGSAHQMGTCRMSRDPSKGVCDTKGKVWDVEGLWISDASVFPSASGVNPMVTTMATAYYIAGKVLEEMEESRGSKALQLARL
ncbi:hypothetical protein YB2330_005394 [Saitoella coloradoensis]